MQRDPNEILEIDGEAVVVGRPRLTYDWDRYEAACDTWAHEKIKSLAWDFKNVYMFEYHDDSSFGSMMEHGGVFDALPNERMSHH